MGSSIFDEQVCEEKLQVMLERAGSQACVILGALSRLNHRTLKIIFYNCYLSIN